MCTEFCQHVSAVQMKKGCNILVTVRLQRFLVLVDPDAVPVDVQEIIFRHGVDGVVGEVWKDSLAIIARI